jgi:hypothetical protein
MNGKLKNNTLLYKLLLRKRPDKVNLYSQFISEETNPGNSSFRLHFIQSYSYIFLNDFL